MQPMLICLQIWKTPSLLNNKPIRQKQASAESNLGGTTPLHPYRVIDLEGD